MSRRCAPVAAEEATLRLFEKRLLHDLGYGLDLLLTEEGAAVRADGHYRYALERGVQACDEDAPGALVGRSLIDLDGEVLTEPRTLRDAKRLLRTAVDACLDGRPLKSREVMLEMRQHMPASDANLRWEKP